VTAWTSTPDTVSARIDGQNRPTFRQVGEFPGAGREVGRHRRRPPNRRAAAPAPMVNTSRVSAHRRLATVLSPVVAPVAALGVDAARGPLCRPAGEADGGGTAALLGTEAGSGGTGGTAGDEATGLVGGEGSGAGGGGTTDGGGGAVTGGPGGDSVGGGGGPGGDGGEVVDGGVGGGAGGGLGGGTQPGGSRWTPPASIHTDTEAPPSTGTRTITQMPTLAIGSADAEPAGRTSRDDTRRPSTAAAARNRRIGIAGQLTRSSAARKASGPTRAPPVNGFCNW
jgi:hypothetical protein